MDADEIMREARKLGTMEGAGAASWVFDGNTTDETYRAFLRGWEDGDPETMDAYAPTSGWLSGEWADARTARDLQLDLGIDDEDPDGEILAEACDAYEGAAEDAYWTELERVARLQTQDDEA